MIIYYAVLILMKLLSGAILFMFLFAVLWIFEKITKQTTTFRVEVVVLFLLTPIVPFIFRMGIERHYGSYLKSFIYDDLPAFAVALLMLWWMNKGDNEDEDE